MTIIGPLVKSMGPLVKNLVTRHIVSSQSSPWGTRKPLLEEEAQTKKVTAKDTPHHLSLLLVSVNKQLLGRIITLEI